MKIEQNNIKVSNERRKAFGLLQTNITYFPVCFVHICCESENPYNAFTKEPSTQTLSKRISIHSPKIWLTLGRTLLPSGPSFTSLQSEAVGAVPTPKLRSDFIQVFFQLYDFPYAFISSDFFFSRRLVFSNCSVLIEPKYLSIFLLFNLQREY